MPLGSIDCHYDIFSCFSDLVQGHPKPDLFSIIVTVQGFISRIDMRLFFVCIKLISFAAGMFFFSFYLFFYRFMRKVWDLFRSFSLKSVLVLENCDSFVDDQLLYMKGSSWTSFDKCCVLKLLTPKALSKNNTLGINIYLLILQSLVSSSFRKCIGFSYKIYIASSRRKKKKKKSATGNSL